MTLFKEEFKSIKCYEGMYEISNYGRVISLKFNREKILKHILNNSCQAITLCKNGIAIRFDIHRLVAETFLDKSEEKNEVNHIDGNPQNNKVTNLEWCTHLENVRHAFKTDLIKRKPLTVSQKERISAGTKKAMKRKDVQENFINQERW